MAVPGLDPGTAMAVLDGGGRQKIWNHRKKLFFASQPIEIAQNRQKNRWKILQNPSGIFGNVWRIQALYLEKLGGG